MRLKAWLRRNVLYLVGGVMAVVALAAAAPALAVTLPNCSVTTASTGTVSCGTTAVSATTAISAFHVVLSDVYAVVGTIAILGFGGVLVLKMLGTTERSSPETMKRLGWFVAGLVLYFGIGTVTGLIQGFAHLL